MLARDSVAVLTMMELDARLRSIGEQNLLNMSSLIEAIAQYPVINRGISSKEVFDDVVKLSRDELARKDLQPFVRL